jgi:hypothetical protein
MEENESNELNKKIVDKVNFFRFNEKLVHVVTVPKGSFKNGMFVSELEQGRYFWFIENKSGGIPIRLFLSEIYDIREYNERNKEEEGG